MKSLKITAFGGNEVLELQESPIPQVKGNQVLVKVACVGLNPLDYKVRSGEMRMITGKKFPLSPGYEFAGIIAETGSGARHFHSGQRVFGGTGIKGGALSEFIVASESDLAAVPDDLSLVEASTLSVAGLTAWQCLFEKGHLEKGQHILLNGASGGVGSYATCLAALAGAKTTAFCSHLNVDYVRELGADRVFDYKEKRPGDLSEKFDLIFDISSTMDLAEVRECLGPSGIYVNTLPSPKLFLHQLWTSWQSKKIKTYLLKFHRPQAEMLAKKFAENQWPVQINSEHRLEEAAEALSQLENEGVRGKIAVILDPNLIE